MLIAKNPPKLPKMVGGIFGVPIGYLKSTPGSIYLALGQSYDNFFDHCLIYNNFFLIFSWKKALFLYSALATHRIPAARGHFKPLLSYYKIPPTIFGNLGGFLAISNGNFNFFHQECK